MDMKKKKSNLEAPSLLLWKMPFEFETPLTFEQCVTRLELFKSVEDSFPTMYVELISRSEDRFQFKIEDRRGWLGDGWTLGNVQYLDNRELSLVSGMLGIAPSLLFYAPIGLVFISCLTVFSSLWFLSGPLFFLTLVCSIFLYGVFLYRAITLRRNFYADLKNLFTSAPTPENHFAEFLDESQNVENQPSTGEGSRGKDAGRKGA
jgi:hypothetical protein